MSKLSDFVGGGSSTSSLPVYVNNSASGTVTLDFSQYNVFEITTSGDVTLDVIGLPSAERAAGAIFVDNLSQSSVSINNVDISFNFLGFLAPFDLSAASYDSVNFSVAGQDANPYDIAFNNDGTKMFMVGINSDSVHQYTLTTGFDLSTASYDSVSFSVGTQDANPYGIAFNNDGTKMFIVGNNSDSVYQYTLVTGFDLSAAIYEYVSFSVAGQVAIPYGIAFNNDGTKMFMVGINSNSVYQYTLTTGFDLSTASYDSVNFNATGQDAVPFGIAFNNDGTKMFMVGNNSVSVHQYTLGANYTRLDCYQRDNVIAAVGRYF